jgi:hypothetical protein
MPVVGATAVPREHISNATNLVNVHSISAASGNFTMHSTSANMLFAVYAFFIQNLSSSTVQTVTVTSGAGGTVLGALTMIDTTNTNVFEVPNHWEMPNTGMPYFIGVNAGDDLVYSHSAATGTMANFLGGEITPRGVQ